jgi:hypothetical protein
MKLNIFELNAFISFKFCLQELNGSSSLVVNIRFTFMKVSRPIGISMPSNDTPSKSK